MEKTCPRCNVTKPLTEWHKSSKTKDGLQAWCKSCRKEYNKKYEISRSKRTEYNRARWEKIKDDPQMVAYRKEWVSKNRDRLQEYSRSYYRNNRILMLHHRSNQKARERGYEGILSLDDWKLVLSLTDGQCIACEENAADSIDHVLPLVKGGMNTVQNIQPMCIKCNLKKGTRLVDFRSEEFVRKINSYSESKMGK